MRNRRRIFWISGVSAIILLLLTCVTRPNSPSGRYVADSRIGQSGDFYWEFSDGKVAFVMEEGRYETFGTYDRTPLGWFWTNTNAKVAQVINVRCSWWQLSFYDQAGHHVGTMRRRIFPGLRPHWFQRSIPDWVQ